MLNFNFFKKNIKNNSPKFEGNLGYLSTYNIEDLYFHFGKNRIEEKKKELMNKPTMGIRLEDFIKGENIMGFHDKGPIYCLALFVDWFSDSLTLEYLFNKVNTYTEGDYMKNCLWEVNRIKVINNLINTYQRRQERVSSNSNLSTIEELKMHLTYNYYYVDYHFFLISLYRKLLTTKDEELKLRIISSTLIDYPDKIENIKKSLVDLNIWVEKGLGNSILQALEKYCNNTNQLERYRLFFDKAAEDKWRF